MRRHRSSGFVFLPMLMLIVMVGTTMFILSQISINVMYTADTAILDAGQANLTASALAWAAANPETDSTVTLDVTELAIGDAQLKVTANPQESIVHVDLSCSKKTYTRKHAADYCLAPE